MINNDGSITVTNEEGKELKVYVLFNFEVVEFKKKYIAYTTNMDSESNEVDVLISEIDYDTYEIKSIPVEDMEHVLEIYKNIKESLLAEGE